MTTLKRCGERLYANCPPKARFMDSRGRFLFMETVQRGVHGCPELPLKSEQVWYVWDTYHSSWQVLDQRGGLEVWSLEDMKSE